MVYKHRLPTPVALDSEQYIHTMRGAELLHVAVQDGIPFVWALVDPSEPMVKRTVRVYATGEPIDDDVTPDYVGTFHIDWTVWHVFSGGET